MNAKSWPTTVDDIELRLLLDAIYYRYHYDFRNYAMASVRRRVTVAMENLGCETLAALQARILREEEAFSRLLQDLTIQVTDMFRDPLFFRAFREEIIPVLRTYPSIRLWVAGCATGEELYSYAVILREEGLLDRAILYGTDISPQALRKAESGVYELSRVRTFTNNHRLTGAKSSLSEHYTAAYQSVAFDQCFKRRAVFADHSLATDNVFAEVQVVSCRNVFIYFDSMLQERALGLIRRSLCRRGYLGLGSRETLQFSSHSSAFRELVAEQRWYQKK